VHTNTLGSATSKSLVLHCEPDASEVGSSKAPSIDQIDGEISLTECIGHGATGQVYTGIAGDEKYILKIAPWKDGQWMLQQEADIYEVLSELQGRCIPKVYGFFRSEHLKVLIMTYMGRTVMNISDLNIDQRCAVPSW
jgi:predicted Ser/Thr protein kinase